MNLLIKEESTILVPSKKDVLKIVLYVKLLLKGIKPFDNDLDILVELFDFGCYHDKDSQTRFFEILLEKKLRNSVASARNKISDFTEKGILFRPYKNAIRFTKDFLPTIDYVPEKVGFISKITHAS